MPSLDVARAVAALSVVVYHALYQPAVSAGTGEAWWRLGNHLDVGVPIFLALSGFLLYRPFVAARVRGEAPRLSVYALRRAARIVPAYWVALAVITVWLSLDQVRDEPLTFLLFAQVYDSATALGGIGQAWTLNVEVVFYATLPLWVLLLRVLARRHRSALLGADLAGLAILWLASQAWIVWALRRSDPSSRESLDLLLPFPGHLDHLVLGMALAVVSAAPAGTTLAAARAKAARFSIGGWWVAALILWLGVCWLIGPDGSTQDLVDDRTYLLRHIAFGAVAAVVVVPAAVAASGERLIGTRPIGRFLRWVGLISYSLYLWHFAVAHEVLDRLGVPSTTAGWIGSTALIVAASLVVAWLSYQLVERPGIVLGRRLSARRGADAPLPVAAIEPLARTGGQGPG